MSRSKQYIRNGRQTDNDYSLAVARQKHAAVNDTDNWNESADETTHFDVRNLDLHNMPNNCW